MMNTTHYFNQRLNDRFKMSVHELLSEIQNYKRYTQVNKMSCPWKEVRKKLFNPNYPNSIYYVNQKDNMIVVADGDLLINCLYLDGTWGYEQQDKNLTII